MRILFFISIILISISCSSSRNATTDQLIGKYQWHGFYDIGSNITLNKDNTFVYYWQTGLINGITKGTWKKNEEKIILNSEFQPSSNGIENFEIINIERRKSDSLSIHVIDYENDNILFASCILKKDTEILSYANTDLYGKAMFPKVKADSIEISYIGFKTIRCKLDHSASKYVFKMEEGNEYYEYFTDEVFIYKSGRLYDPRIKKSKYVKKDFYEKVK